VYRTLAQEGDAQKVEDIAKMKFKQAGYYRKNFLSLKILPWKFVLVLS
jgi:hypothetical protein